MKSKQRSALWSDVIGIFCGVLLVVIGVASVIAANAGKVAGLRDAQIPETAATMVGTAPGRNGDITVQVKADATRIYQIRVLAEDETQGIGSVAVKKLPAAIYAGQSLEVDSISGATISSDGVKNAVYNALANGGVDAYRFGYRLIKADRLAARVETGSGVSVIRASDWEADYPEIYASYMQNAENDVKTDYTTEYPMIQTLYDGYGFAYSYDSARGHAYVFEDLYSTGRPHKLANCFTCKTPDFTALVNATDGEAYAWDFEDVMQQVNEPLSCYNCHANTPGELTVTHTYLSDAVGDDFERIDAADLACGQCHVEYYFDPDTKATTLPHDSVASMSPDAILNYYNTELLVDGEPFADYTNPGSGVRQIKVQHPEFETFLGEGSVHRGKFTCADCHMGELTTASGTTVKSHYLVSPLENDALLQNTCSECHTDLRAEVQAIQDATVKRTVAIGERLEELQNQLTAASGSGAYTETELNAIRSVARDAQFYWDFVFVENSNGAHNSQLTNDCLDKAEKLTEQALAMFH